MTEPTDPQSMFMDFDGDEPDDENTPTIRGKWVMDGASTLVEAAAKLRAYADHLEMLYTEGWQLEGPIEDDYGYLRRR